MLPQKFRIKLEVKFLMNIFFKLLFSILGRDEHHYLVVDTNIWLGEQLNALKKLLHDYTNPWIISVPYVVLDEIDTKRKKDKRLKIAACKAMRVLGEFINVHLLEL